MSKDDFHNAQQQKHCYIMHEDSCRQICLVWFGLIVTVTDISRPCQPDKLNPLQRLDPSFSGHNDEPSSASGQDYASNRSDIGLAADIYEGTRCMETVVHAVLMFLEINILTSTLIKYIC